MPHSLVKKELNKIQNLKYEVLELTSKKLDYVLMTNRLGNSTGNKVGTCFNNFPGKDLVTVKRNGLILSTLRKVTN